MRGTPPPAPSPRLPSAGVYSSSLTPPFLGINNNSLTPPIFFSGRTPPPIIKWGEYPPPPQVLGLLRFSS